jgi:hypothetical protein
MATALQCPACGAKHALAALPPGGPTFRCDRCGRTLKVPARLRSTDRATPPARRDRDGTTVPRRGVETRGAATVATTPAPPGHARDEATRERRTLAWPSRLLAWLLAIPAGLVAVLVPARRFDFLSGQRLLDVLVGTGYARYWRVLVIAPAWALVTTILVTLITMLFRKLGERRRALRAEGEAPRAQRAVRRRAASRAGS